jgi:hypothetical protein
MKGGKHIPPDRKRLAADLLDRAEGRETCRQLNDVLIQIWRHRP